MSAESHPQILIGWASREITPPKTVTLAGQFHTRVAEGIMDPLTITALAMESPKGGRGDAAVMVSCDLVGISDELRDAARAALRKRIPDLDPMKVFFNATHTHTAPPVSSGRFWNEEVDLGLHVTSVADYCAFAAGRIAEAVEEAWKNRAPGGVSYGLGQAVVGHNRRGVDANGNGVMYPDLSTFRLDHIEGYEDHSLNLLFTYDNRKRLTGMIINLSCTSQVSEMGYEITADFWHDTRLELRKRHGEHIFILPQCAAAGDQSPHNIIRKPAEDRMLALAGRTKRQDIACRIANGVDAVLPYMEKVIETNVRFSHKVEVISLARRLLTQQDVDEARAAAEAARTEYEKERRAIENDPSARQKPRWYTRITLHQRSMQWNAGVEERYRLQKAEPKIPVEVHVIRLGDVAFASNPFELYLDYGIRIIAHSQAIQTFVIQLAGSGTYLPSARSVACKGYGSVAASTTVGPEGGQELVERSLEMINSLWT